MINIYSSLSLMKASNMHNSLYHHSLPWSLLAVFTQRVFLNLNVIIRCWVIFVTGSQPAIIHSNVPNPE